MGCGASKLEPDQEGRFRPVFRRRLEEFIARRHVGLSKKQLLQGDAIIARDSGVVEEDKITLNDKHKEDTNNKTQDCNHVFHDTQDSPPIPQVIAPNVEEVHNDTANSVVNDDDNNNNDDGQKCVNKKEEDNNSNNNNNETKVEEEKVMPHEDHNKESLHEDQEEECRLDDGAKLDGFSIGSPSFRFYCVNTQSLDEELEEIAEDLHSEDCINEDDKKCSFQESSDSNEVSSDDKQIIKKPKKRRFRRIAMPKGGKRVLHNMHSFYHFPCSCNSQNSQLMQQQQTTA